MIALTSHTRRLAVATAGGLLVAVALAGCSSDSTDDSTSTAGSPSEAASESETASAPADVCADADTAKASLDALLATDVLQEGTATVKERAATVRSDVEALLASGSSELAPLKAAVEASISSLEDVLKGLPEELTAAEVAAIKPALEAAKTSVVELFDAVGSTC
jgi:hypothetical protein